MDEPSYFFFYSIGTVLAAYLSIVPTWLLSLLWNRVLPRWRINPWTVPFCTGVALMSLLACGVGQPVSEANDDWIVALGFVPAVAWCGMRRKRHSAPAELTPEL